MKLKTEIKLLLLIAFILSIGFSVINFISVSSYRSQLYQKVKSEADLYQVLLLYDLDIQLPRYFKLFKELPTDYQTWEILGKVKEHFLVLNKKEVNREILRYALFLFAWELPVLLLTIFVVYKATSLYLKRERESKEFVKLFFLLFTHKLGNFLSLDRLSIELLLQKYGNDRSLLRLKRSYELLEDDFKKSLNYMKAFEENEEPEVVDVSTVLKELIYKYHAYYPLRRVEVLLQPLKVKARRGDIENLFQLLIENAFKYSSSFVKVEARKSGKGYLVSITNDLGSAPSGSSIGLKMAQFLAERLNWSVEVHPGSKEFIVDIFLK